MGNYVISEAPLDGEGKIITNITPSSGMGDSSDPFTKGYQNLNWNVNISLTNQKQTVYVKSHMFKQLCIEDDVLTWPMRGYVVIDNQLEAFERDGYYIRSDARDEIIINIKPDVSDTLPSKIWQFGIDCIVYDVEDLPSLNSLTKLKKLYFWDKSFQLLLERNIEWSTTNGRRFISPQCPTPAAHATDEQRSMFTGEAIASLIDAAGLKDIIDFDNWDYGAGKICYAAPANKSVWDSIQYLLSLHVSSDTKNDICILQWDRATNKLTFKPFWKIFTDAGHTKDNPGKLQIEHMFFEEHGANDTGTTSPYKAPINKTSTTDKDIKVDPFNKIMIYTFSQTSGLDNAKAFVTKPVYSHWHKNKQFDVDVKENEIQYVKDKCFKVNYVSQLLSQAQFPIMTLNKAKTEEYAIEPIFSPVSTTNAMLDRKIRSAAGKGSTLYSGIFLNHHLGITVQGSTHRLAGTFIGIDKFTDSDNAYDYQLCGQYFVVNVKHIFQQQKYMNELSLVKIHAYDTLPSNEGVY